MSAHVNWFRAVFLASAGYGLLFVAARSVLPARAWTEGRTPLGYAVSRTLEFVKEPQLWTLPEPAGYEPLHWSN